MRLLYGFLALAAVAAAGCSSPAPASGPGTTPASQGAPAARWEARTSSTGVVGTWSYGSEFVVAGNKGVTAFSQATGQVVWRLPPPSATTQYCGASTAAEHGEVAVGIGEQLPSGPNAECHTVGLIDLRSGRLVWTQSVPKPSQTSELQGATAALAPHGIMVGIAGNTVVAAWQAVYAGFSLSQGVRRWTRLLPGAANISDASVYDVVPAGPVTYLTAMATFGGVPTVLAVSSATGAIRARSTLPQRLTGVRSPGSIRVVGTSPVTVLVRDEMSSAGALVVLNGHLAARAIRSGSVASPRPAPGRDLDLVDPASNVAVHGYYPVLQAAGSLFAVTVPGDNPPGNPLVAYDAATGARRWTASVPGTDMVAPVAVDGSTLVAEGTSEYGHGDPVIVRLNLATGAVVSAKTFSTGGRGQLGGIFVFYGYTWSGGRTFAVDWNAAMTGPTVPSVIALG